MNSKPLPPSLFILNIFKSINANLLLIIIQIFLCLFTSQQYPIKWYNGGWSMLQLSVTHPSTTAQQTLQQWRPLHAAFPLLYAFAIERSLLMQLPYALAIFIHKITFKE